MSNNLKEELRKLASSILNENEELELASQLEYARELYEKLLIANHLNKVPQDSLEKELLEERAAFSIESIEEIEQEPKIEAQEPKIEEQPEAIETVIEVEETPVVKEEDAPLSLNDLFVPTFDDIKEDMSQKAEFKDTISLDETEKLFQTKKEEPRQLSLNDKLVGNSIQVGLNDRIAFVNKLFNFSQSDFNKVLSKLNDCATKEEALRYFQYQVKPNYNWKGKEELEERLVNLIERKYM